MEPSCIDEVDNGLVNCRISIAVQSQKDMLDMATSNLPDLSSSRNGASSPIFDSSGSDVLAVSQTGNNLMSKSFTNSDSALPLSYSSTPFAPRAPSLPPSNTSKYSTSSDTNIAPPEVPIRTTSSPKKNASLPLFIGREWVLEKFSRWLQLSSDNTPVSTEAMSCSFIILGGPGAGKTSLFNQIIRKDCLGISNRLLAYHACSNQFAATLNLPRFILSLRDQLIARQDSIGAFYRERISANGGRLNRLFTSARMCAFPDEVLSEGIFKVLSDLDTRQIGSEQKLFFAIDAADECLRFNPTSEVRAPPSISSIGCSHKRLSQASSTSDHANEFQSLNLHQSSGRIRQGWVSRNLLELLAVNALFLPPWIGIFITCRRDSQTILRRLFRCASTAFLDDTRCPLVVKDLNDYVLSRVKNDPLLSNIFFCGHDTLQVLQYKSNGSILYLHIVLSAVSEGWLTPEYIKTIPGTINGLFLWLSQRLLNPIPNDPSTLIMTIIKPILNLVLTTPRPLTLTETDVILQANNVSPKILENWKQVLIQPFFLTHDYPVFLVQQQPQQWIDLLDYADLQHERVLSLAHTSLRDWYLDVKYSTPVYLASSRDGHTMLALAALSQIKRTPGLSHSFTWDILYNFARSSLYNSPEAIQKLTSALRDVELDFTVDTLANLDCWMFLHDPILVHCSFAGSSISQLIEDALNYEHRTFEPQLGLQTCNGTRNLDRKPKQVLLRTGADKETSIGQLCTAAFQGKLDVVKSILAQASVDIESRDAAGSTPLVLAARQGNLEIVKCLLDARARLDQIDQDGWSALRSAAWGGHYDVVNLLLESGVDVDIMGPDNRTALRAAAWAGHSDIVHRLLEAGADVNRPDTEGRTPLIAAAYMGCVEIIDILADAGANLNHADQDGRTALCVAAFCVPQSALHSAVVAKLLQLGVDPNIGDREHVTPLIGAANTGRRDICELCLEADADVDMVDRSGRSALVAAVVNGHVDVVQLLLFWCAAVDTIDLNGRSVLSIAAACGHTQVVRQLLDRGLDEGHRDHMGATPLHLAAAAGHADVVRLLLEAGSHPDEVDNAGQTPLLVACQADHVNVVHLLLKPAISVDTGADIDRIHELFDAMTMSRDESVDIKDDSGDPHGVYDPLTTGGQDGFLGHAALKTIDQASMDGRSPLRVAALNNNILLVKLLIALGADPDQQDACGRTTLSVVVLEGLVKMAKVILFTPTACIRSGSGDSGKKKLTTGLVGANPLIADDEGRFPLHIAAWQGDLAMVHLLIQVGTPVDVRDKENRTPLHSAAWQNHAKTCGALIELGANINAVCSQGASALCIAAQEGHLAVCEMLLQRGANAQQVDAYGRTPFKVAMKAGHGEICSLLERYGAAPPPSSPTRSRHRWKQMTPTGATKSTQQTQSHRHHRQLHHSQQLQSRPDRETASADHNASGFAGFGGSIKMGSVVMTSGSTILPQAQLSQREITSGAYARPSLALMKSVRMPPPHLSSSQQLQPTSQPVVPVPIPPHHQQQPQTTNWSTSTMSFDPSQWQSLFPQGLRLSSGVPWCPPPQGTQSIYTPPFLFTPQNFDINQAHQSLYQPAYVLSPQGILVPAQAPYFVPVAQHPQFQPNIRSQVQSGISPQGVFIPQSCAPTVSIIENSSSVVNSSSQRPPSFSTIEDLPSSANQNMEAPANLTFSGAAIASPIVTEPSSQPYHYSVTSALSQEDTQKPSSERPTIQLIVNTKLGEDVINLNEVTDSEYESSVWVSRRQVTVLTEAAVERGSKLKKAFKGRQSVSPERQHHPSKVKAVIQGALKGARRKKNPTASTPNTPGSTGGSTIPVRDKKLEKLQLQNQESQIHTETHI